MSLLIPSSVLQTTNRRLSRYLARVVQVFPPRPPPPPPIARAQANGFASSSSSSPLSDEGPTSIHKIAEDLKVTLQESTARDDPTKYTYKVQILEEEKAHGTGKGGERAKGKEVNKSKYTGSLMDVKCMAMRYAPNSPVYPSATVLI